MAKRYFKVLKGQVFFIVLVVALICFTIIAEGPAEKIANVITGAAMIFGAVAFSVWMIKKPARKVREENL